jgi:hypothetical protein
LADTLIENACYYFEMYVNLTNTCKFTTDAIGAYFSDTAITGLNNFDPLPITPQISNNPGNLFDTLEWTQVSMIYQALGGETYLIVGNFMDDATSTLTLINNDAPFDFAYVLVDDVSLTPCKATGEESLEKYKVHIYPNPATDYLTIETNTEELSTVTVYDFSNRKILEQSFNRTVVLSLMNLPVGLYFFEFIHGNEAIREKIIVY